MRARQLLGILSMILMTSCQDEPPAPHPVANFFVENAGCTSPCYVKFYDQSYSAEKHLWEFGNTLTSESVNDSTLYHTPGNYNVTLHVWNADNVEDLISKTVTVY